MGDIPKRTNNLAIVACRTDQRNDPILNGTGRTIARTATNQATCLMLFPSDTHQPDNDPPPPPPPPPSSFSPHSDSGFSVSSSSSGEVSLSPGRITDRRIDHCF